MTRTFLRKPVAKKCPKCNSTRFRDTPKNLLPEGVLVQKTCMRCGFVNKITQEIAREVIERAR